GYGTDVAGTPRLGLGDQIVWYAVKWRVIYGLAEVTGEPEQRRVREWQEDRWSWYMRTRTRFVVPDLSVAPTLADVGLPWVRVRRYIGLSRDQFVACSQELRRVGQPYDSTQAAEGS